jgi:hypothetical protein
MIHVWREILKRNLSPCDICRLAQTCTLLRRLCAEQNVWEPFGPHLKKVREIPLLPKILGQIKILEACQIWFLPFATDVTLVVQRDWLVCSIHFKFENREYQFGRCNTYHPPMFRMTIIFHCNHRREYYDKAIEFDARKFLWQALNERCTPQWMWENNPLAQEIKKTL